MPQELPYFLELRDVTKRFGQFTALDDVRLGVKPGEFITVLGPSGCGKTTLLRVVAGLEDEDTGSVWIQGRDVTREPIAKRKLGIVFQSYALFPNLTVLKNVQYGLAGGGRTAAERQNRAMETLDLVGLADQRDKYPAQLSGGQQQRVALARALAPNPALLLLDEPLSALDARVRMRLRGEIRRIHEKLGVTTVMVTHDQEEALTMADRIVVMDRGRIMQYSPPRRLYAAPTNPFVAGFIGTMNFLPHCRRDARENGARFLAYPLTVASIAPSATGGHAETLTLAIRPEHVRPDGAAGETENRLRARVRYVEFRGAVYRVTLQVLYPDGAPSEHTIDMDVQPKTVDQMDLTEHRDLSVQLPARHLLAFAGEANASSGGRRQGGERDLEHAVA